MASGSISHSNPLAPESLRTSAGRERWVRPLVVILGVLVVLALSGAWVRAARSASHDIMAYRAPGAPNALTVAYPSRGLSAGDRILAVDGVPLSDPRASANFWRVHESGDQLALRVQRAVPGERTAGPIEDVVVAAQSPLVDRDTAILFAVTTIWALMWLALMVVVAMARPNEPVVGPLVVYGAALALSIPPPIWVNVTPENWDLGIRAAYFLPAFGSIAGVHLFLIFPSTNPFMGWLRRLGPGAFQRLHGGTVLLYLVPTAIAFAFAAGPVETIGAAYLVFIVCTILTLVAMVHSYRHPVNPLIRPQLQWIFLSYAFALAGAVVLSALINLTGEPAELTRSALYAVLTLVPLAIAFSVLRYRLFDVERVVRETVTYAILTGLLIAAYFALTFVATRATVLLVGPAVVSGSGVILVLSAAVVAIAAMPLHNRLQDGLRRLVYRSREARRQFLQEAVDLLGRAQPLDVMEEFLTVQASHRLGLTGAWLILPPALRGAADVFPESEALVDQFRDAVQPVFLTREDLSASAVSFLRVAGPTLTSWYARGARLLVPLRASGDSWASPGGRGDEIVGIWALGGLRFGDLPDRDDLATLTRIGEQAAVLLDYVRLSGEQVHQELVRRELERGRQIQQQLLPLPYPGGPGRLDLAARLQSAEETSGDFYDYADVPVSAQSSNVGPDTPSGSLLLALGDVQGKGVGSALVSAMAVAGLRSSFAPTGGMALGPPSPSGLLGQLSRLLNQSAGTQNFVCCVLALVEPAAAGEEGPRIVVANAGQVPPRRVRDGVACELVPEGERLPLGVDPTLVYGELSRQLKASDVVIFASDGFVEAPRRASTTAEGSGNRSNGRAHDDMFGFERLDRSAEHWSRPDLSAQETLDGMWSDLLVWSGGDFHHDDVTLVVLQVPPAKAASGDVPTPVD